MIGPMNQRIVQIESALKRAISQVLMQKLSDPRVTGMISVTRITVSPDLHDAYVYVSVLPARSQTQTLNGLRHAGTHIYQKVCELVKMKRVPHLDFRLDESIKKQAQVLEAIRRGREKDSRAQTEPSAAPGSRIAEAIPEMSGKLLGKFSGKLPGAGEGEVTKS